MARASKPVISIKLTPGKRKQIEGAVADLVALYVPLMAEWPCMPPAQRAEVLAHSPLLAALLGLFGGRDAD